MPISVVCPKGHKLTAKDKLAGKRVKCPKCGKTIQIPEMEVLGVEDGLTPIEPDTDTALPSTASAPLGPLDSAPLDPLDSAQLGQAHDQSEEDEQPYSLADELSAPSSAAPGDLDPLDAGGKQDPLGVVDFDENDPFGDGDLPGLVEVPAEDLNSPLLAASPQPEKPVARKEAAKSTASKTAVNIPLLAGAIGGGLLIGLIVFGFVAWMLFSGGDAPVAANDSTNANVASSAASTPAGSGDSSASSAQTPAVSGAAAPGTTSAAGASPAATTGKAGAQQNPTQPAARARQPHDLFRLNVDPLMAGFKFPGITWAVAYDEPTGRLAITNDEKGILIYDIDELKLGNPAPVAAFATKGLPTAVCLKPLGDQRLFVVASQGAAELALIDAETLKPMRRLALGDVNYVDFLAGSENPADPFVYYSTQMAERGSRGTDEDSNDRLGRVNLLTLKQDGHSKERFADVIVSADGSRLYARDVRYSGNGAIGSWDEVKAFDKRTRKTASWSNPTIPSPPRRIGAFMAINEIVFDPMLSVRVTQPDFLPVTAFRDRAVLLGLSRFEMVFASANDYRRFGSIRLPEGWLRYDEKPDPADFRQRPALSRAVRSSFMDMIADSKRNLGLAIFGENMLVAPLESLKIPAEPSLAVQSSFPAELAPDTPFEMALNSAAPGVEYEYVPNTDWLPNEKTRLLGLLPPGQPSSRPLALAFSPKLDSNTLRLKSYNALRGINPPFNLRVGNEIMVVTKYGRSELVVNRTNRMRHYSHERVAVVDNNGREIKIAEASRPKSLGKRLTLAAAVAPRQNLIYVTDVDQLAGTSLPAQIQIGEEKMTLIDVDDFTTSLTVKRSEERSHSVSSEVWLIDAALAARENSPNLPVVSGNTFRWTPSVEQIGEHRIRMRARLGKMTHEWFWNVRVKRQTTTMPFKVVGIEPQPGSNLAVVWGQSALPAINAAPANAPITYYIGVYDHRAKKLLRHVKVAKPIGAAVLDSSGVYASLIAFDLERKPDRDAEREREAAMRKITPTQIVRFDPQTLEIVEQTAAPRHARRLQIIAGKYLVSYERWRNQSQRFNIPDLTPVEPSVGGYEYAVSGRLKDGWLWDGVVWNEDLSEPRLLLFPVHFERPRAHSPPEMTAAEGGVIDMRRQGPYVGSWRALNQSGGRSSHGHTLVDLPGVLTAGDGQVHAISLADLSAPRVGETFAAKSVQLFDLRSMDLPRDPRRRAEVTTGYVSEADGNVHVAMLGNLYTVPLSRLLTEQESFHFVERQDQFVLKAGEPAKLQYSAPNAERYVLQVWGQRPHFGDDKPTLSLESNDGVFEVPAKAFSSNFGSALSGDKLKQAAPQFKQVTGREPKGKIHALYVSVIAYHKDGQRKAGLAHAYLVESPGKE